MSERIDHAAGAQMHIKWVHEWQEQEGAMDATELATVFLAPTHATLAACEEQRIANLIALSQVQDGIGTSAYSALAVMSPDRRRTILDPNIAAALGIGDVDE